MKETDVNPTRVMSTRRHVDIENTEIKKFRKKSEDDEGRIRSYMKHRESTVTGASMASASKANQSSSSSSQK